MNSVREPLTVPESIRKCKLLHGNNQRQALVYVAQKMQWKEDYTFSHSELAGVLGMEHRPAAKLCKALRRINLLIAAEQIKLEVPPEMVKDHRNKVYGFTYYLKNQYRANVSLIKSLFGDALPQNRTTTNTYLHIKEYSPNQVEGVLNRFLTQKGLIGAWSPKRKGWLIRCPGACNHTDKRKRRDETVLYTTPKSNGFLYISTKCYHESCGSHLMEWCKQLNKEWGKYFYESQHGVSRKQKNQNISRPSNASLSNIPEVKALDLTGECILSFMTRDQAETLSKQVEDMNAELHLLRKQCWRNSQAYKRFNDVRYKFTADYWRYGQAWQPYYVLRDTRNEMLSRLSELNDHIEKEEVV